MVKHTILILFSFAFSAFIFSMMAPGNYIAMAIFGFILAACALFAKQGIIDNREGAPAMIWLGAVVLFSGVVATLWPASPVILAIWRTTTVDEER